MTKVFSLIIRQPDNGSLEPVSQIPGNLLSCQVWVLKEDLVGHDNLLATTYYVASVKDDLREDIAVFILTGHVSCPDLELLADPSAVRLMPFVLLAL